MYTIIIDNSQFQTIFYQNDPKTSQAAVSHECVASGKAVIHS
jgi:hypothetical protein